MSTGSIEPGEVILIAVRSIALAIRVLDWLGAALPAWTPVRLRARFQWPGLRERLRLSLEALYWVTTPGHSGSLFSSRHPEARTPLWPGTAEAKRKERARLLDDLGKRARLKDAPELCEDAWAWARETQRHMELHAAFIDFPVEAHWNEEMAELDRIFVRAHALGLLEREPRSVGRVRCSGAHRPHDIPRYP